LSIWKSIKAFGDTLLAFAGLVGVIYLVQDIEELPVALQKWRALVPVDRERALIGLSVLLVAYIAWMDARPFVRRWLRHRRIEQLSGAKRSVARFVRASSSFTLKEAASLLAMEEITNDQLKGAAAGILNDLHKSVRRGELVPVNARDGEIFAPRSMHEQVMAMSGEPTARRLYGDLEISKNDLFQLADKYDAEIPGRY
jgi:hypothetical protein